MNVVYETEHFLLRPVRAEDARELLECYRDPEAVTVMNADCCTTDFHFETPEQMRACIDFRLKEMARGAYVRFAVTDKSSRSVIGAAEIFGGTFGVLRLDLCTAYETEALLVELLTLAAERLGADFSAEFVCFKAVPKARARVAALKACEFEPAKDFRPGLHYYRRRVGARSSEGGESHGI